MIKLITVTNAPEHAEVLRRSAELHGWDFHCEVVEWKGYGTKLMATYAYLKAHPEVDRFVFADAFDVVVFGTPEEFERKLPSNDGFVFNAERGLWPPNMEPYRELFGDTQMGFNYLNSGCYFAERKPFISMLESHPINYSDDDQMYFIERYVSGYGGFILDTNQKVFNCHSFIREGEYAYIQYMDEYNRKFGGNIEIMGNKPIFVHSNGRTVDPQLDKLVKEMLA